VDIVEAAWGVIAAVVDAATLALAVAPAVFIAQFLIALMIRR
jgi:hypothetical protein